MSKFHQVNEEYACLMTVEEFREQCKLAAFVNDDGSGYFARNVPGEWHEEDTEAWAIPSEFYKGTEVVPDWATHVAWYNK